MNETMVFKKAEKKQAKLRLAITGPSGSGKTYSALQIASGIGKRIAFLDTENDSASLYADEFNFDTIKIDPPYTIDKYLDGIQAAIDAKYDVLVIDSISHVWAGEGGLLEKKSAIDARGGNSYTNWAPVTKEHEHFKSALLTCDIHLIATMRSKQDYIMETNSQGKQAPRKVGLAPIQREGMEYEFTMVLDMGMDHSASVSKTRVKSFDGKLFKPTASTGQELLAWLLNGKPLEVYEKKYTWKQAATIANDSPSWPHPAAEVEQQMVQAQAKMKETKELKESGASSPEIADLIGDIKEKLSAMNEGKEEAMNSHLKQLTTYKSKKTLKDEWIQLKDLPNIAKSAPNWLIGIHKKVVEAFEKENPKPQELFNE